MSILRKIFGKKKGSKRRPKPVELDDFDEGASGGTFFDGIAIKEATIEPDSELTRSQSLLSARRIEGSFFIGRRGGAYPGNDGLKPNFALPESEPFTVSKLHCRLKIQGDALVYTDLDTRFGSLLNGERIGGDQSSVKEVCLPRGEHRLTVGGRDSLFKFKLTVR